MMKIGNKIFKIIIPPKDIACNPGCLQRLVAGDRGAYAWLYKQYSRKVFDYAMVVTNNETLSEDIVQEVFLKIWQKRQKLGEAENFNAYLYTLYRNHVMDVLRRRQREHVLKEAYFHTTPFDVATPVDEVISYRQTKQEIAKAVRRLPSRQQMVYMLSREHGWDKDRIADELCISPCTVKVHIQKALKFLRRELAPFAMDNSQ